MALTTTQINQAYIAILGRAAIGTESRVAGDASVSDVAASLIAAQANKGDKGIFATLADKVLAEGKDTNSVSNADFVESLYTTLLNRDTSNDAEGKAFWLKVLNNGASREDLVDSFIKAVIAQKATNTQDYQNYTEQVSVQSDNFVESLYTKLLGRSSDEAGKAYWSGVIADGASYADVAASFAAAAASQGKGTEDGVAISNKLDVANYATTSITAFSKLATEQNIEEVKARIEQMIASTDKDSTAETIAESKKAIDSDANTFKAPGSVTFTRGDDKLGIDANGDYNTTKATDFTGSLNLDDATKGTIQAGDKVYGNIEFADGNILTVNVTGTTTQKTLTLDNGLPGTISGVKNLEIKAGTAQVTGTISNKFTNTVTINAGYTSTEKPNASDITVAHKLDTYTAGAKADKLTVASGASIENVDMGAGNDTIILTKGSAGGAAAKVTNINAGAGNDTIELATVASDNIGDSGDYTSIKKITGVETIKLTGIQGAATSGAQISYDAIKESNKAFNLSSDVNNSGDLTIKAGNNTNIDVSKIVNGELNKETGAYTNKVATLTISDVKQGATIRLDSAVDGNSLADKITLHGDVDDGKLGATIINFAKGDKISVLTDANTAVDTNHFSGVGTATQNNNSGDLTQDVAGVKSIKVNASGAITFWDNTQASGYGKEVTNVSLADAQTIIAQLGGNQKIFSGDAKKAVIFQSGKDAYIIDLGTSATQTNDDVVIKLVGVIIDGTDIKGISASNGEVTLA